MGFLAQACGGFKISADLDLKRVGRLISDTKFSTINKVNICYIEFANSVILSWDSEYHSSETEEFLNFMSCLIEEGSVDFRGEDGAEWGYRYCPDKSAWIEQEVMRVYCTTIADGKKNFYEGELEALMDKIPLKDIIGYLKARDFVVAPLNRKETHQNIVNMIMQTYGLEVDPDVFQDVAHSKISEIAEAAEKYLCNSTNIAYCIKQAIKDNKQSLDKAFQ